VIDVGQIDPGPNFFQPGQKVIQEHQALGPGIRQLMGQFFGAQEGIEHHRHRAQAQGGVVGHHQLGAVGEENTQAVPGGQTQIFQGAGQTGGLGVEFAIRGGPAEKH